MTFKKKIRNEEEQKKYDERMESRSPVFIYHYCLNENLPKEHPDFCFNCWIDECEKQACGQQNWKYCKECTNGEPSDIRRAIGIDRVKNMVRPPKSKKYPEYTLKDRLVGGKIHDEMIKVLHAYIKERKEMVDGSYNFINGYTEADLELVFNKYYPNVKMVKGFYV